MYHEKTRAPILTLETHEEIPVRESHEEIPILLVKQTLAVSCVEIKRKQLNFIYSRNQIKQP